MKKDFTALSNVILAVCRNGVCMCVCMERGRTIVLFVLKIPVFLFIKRF